jgi:hypothetical protein
MLGYTNRDFLVEPGYARRVHPGGGILNAVLLVDGRAAGTWKTKRRKAGIAVILTPFEELPDKLLPHLHAETADLGRFLGESTTLTIEGP